MLDPDHPSSAMPSDCAIILYVRLCRLSNAADRAAEARNRLSGGSFELNPAIAMQPVKRLSEELAAALKARNSWTASVAPFPHAMKADPNSASLRSSMDASSSSRVGAVHSVAAEVMLGPPLSNIELQCVRGARSAVQPLPFHPLSHIALGIQTCIAGWSMQGACKCSMVFHALGRSCSFHRAEAQCSH